MRSLIVLLTVSSALALAGCGGSQRAAEPKIDRSAARQLAAESRAIAASVDAGRTCDAATQADKLDADAKAAVADGRVPRALAAELAARTRALVALLNCLPPPPPPREDGKEHGKKKHKEEKD